MAKKTQNKKASKKVSKKKINVPKPADHSKLYFGKAGHLFVMSELLLLKWNVAIPEVDIGDDIFVVRDRDGAFIKIQVKSANAKTDKGITKATCTTSYSQLIRSSDGQLIYCFAIRHNNAWDRIIIIERTELWGIYQKVTPSAKTRINAPQNITLNITFTANDIFWKGESLKAYLNKYDYFDHQKAKKLII